MIARIARWGEGSALRIPDALAQTLAVKEGDAVTIVVEDGRLRIAAVDNAPASTLDERLAGVTPDNSHGEVDDEDCVDRPWSPT